MVGLTLYGLDPSPPVRAVKLTLAALQLGYKYVQVNVLKKVEEGRTWPRIPSIRCPCSRMGQFDFGIRMPSWRIWCASTPGRTHSIPGITTSAPLWISDCTLVFANALISITKKVLFLGQMQVPRERIEAIVEAYDFLEAFLRQHHYVAGDQLTIADFSLISSISSMVAYVPIDAIKYAKITAWMQRMQELPYYAENATGARLFVASVKKAKFTVVPEE